MREGQNPGHSVSDRSLDRTPHDARPARRCVVLKLASLGMFCFSLGQTVLCIGRNRTSCESYGYNACDYQVPGAPVLPHKAPPQTPEPF